MTKNDEHASKTDDDVARHAAENPLEVAAKSDPKPKRGGLSWTGPMTAVAIAIAILFIVVFVIL